MASRGMIVMETKIKVIKIDAESRKITEVEIENVDQINQLLSGYKECAHRFQSGDRLYVDGDGASKDLKTFDFGSKKYGYKTFFGNGVVVQYADDKWSSTTKQIQEIKRIVKFPRKTRKKS